MLRVAQQAVLLRGDDTTNAGVISHDFKEPPVLNVGSNGFLGNWKLFASGLGLPFYTRLLQGQQHKLQMQQQQYLQQMQQQQQQQQHHQYLKSNNLPPMIDSIHTYKQQPILATQNQSTPLHDANNDDHQHA